MTVEVEQQLFSIKTFLGRVPISRAKMYLEISAGRLRVVHIGTRTFITRKGEADYLRLIEAEAEDRKAA